MKPARGARSATRPDAARARFQHLRSSPPVRCPLFRRLLGEKSSQVPPARRRTSGGNKAEFTVDAATCWGRLTGMRAAAACWPGCYSRVLCFTPSLCRSVHVCAAEEFLSGRGGGQVRQPQRCCHRSLRSAVRTVALTGEIVQELVGL